jgi:hypothetical protein
MCDRRSHRAAAQIAPAGSWNYSLEVFNAVLDQLFVCHGPARSPTTQAISALIVLLPGATGGLVLSLERQQLLCTRFSLQFCPAVQAYQGLIE